MPAMDGARCLATIRAVDPQVRAILSTGFSMTDDVEKTLQQGFCGYIQKPFVMRQLSQAVREALHD
jgi:DNA-binding NarL/FixJ family response regulator